jgi:hypothetical protein
MSNPFWIIANLKNLQTGKFHPIVYRFYPLPNECPVPRYKSFGHHTNGFVFREEALTECIRLSTQISEEYECKVELATEEDMLWDGLETPASVALFTETDGVYRQC